MKPVFLDLHIHTSENPNQVDPNYDVETLLVGVRQISGANDFLISLTDHNTVNKVAYSKLVELGALFILGVELHIRYDESRPPYHCHAYFCPNGSLENQIDLINQQLDKLYPDKIITPSTATVPKLEDIVNHFDDFEFLLLPHGGQNHSTFNKSIPKGHRFDKALERTIYYNQFDGFTARGVSGLEETHDYFSKLGIREFCNLLTCSDNYNPRKYPEPKADGAEAFVPTWMLAEPTFDGLRLSLSEAARLTYGPPPTPWVEYIQGVSLSNDLVDIAVDLTPGLNVVIGGSSSGKTLFVDTLYRQLASTIGESVYATFGVSNVSILNPSGVVPYYIPQNFIMQVASQAEGRSIERIDIMKRIFPGDGEVTAQIAQQLSGLKREIVHLVDAVKRYEVAATGITRIPTISRLVQSVKVPNNPLVPFLPSEAQTRSTAFPDHLQSEYSAQLDLLEEFLSLNPFASYSKEPFDQIRSMIGSAIKGQALEEAIRSTIREHKNSLDAELGAISTEIAGKRANFDVVKDLVSKLTNALRDFHTALRKISAFQFAARSQSIVSMGHTLSLENNFCINREMLLAAINKMLKSEFVIDELNSLEPADLYQSRFSKRDPKVNDYDDFAAKVFAEFESSNRLIYRITTRDGLDFSNLSPGLKTAVLLDLILGFDGDMAPVIIDQPEDNLATNYINRGLVSAIKKTKERKQIIVVSHNATIPMLADAQNVIYCTADSGKLNIRNSSLEGSLGDERTIEVIAEITDGGKSSIKKRVKKYNLKSYKGES